MRRFRLRDRHVPGADTARRIIERPAVSTAVSIVGLALTLVAILFTDPIAAAIVAAGLIVAAALLGVYGLVIRDRLGGIHQVVREEQIWEIFDERGEHAEMTRHRTTRVLQDGVFALRDFTFGTAPHTNPRASPWPVVHVFDDDAGRRTAIMVLDEPRPRGSTLDYRITWDADGVFVDEANWVSSEPLFEIRKLTLRVIFPRERPATKARFTTQDEPERPEDLPVQVRSDGRAEIVKTLRYPKPHRTYKLTFRW